MRAMALCVVAASGAACFGGGGPGFEEGYRVGGTVSGMWDGAATTLRLQATGVDELLTVDGNQPFEFETALVVGASFTITVETAPVAHDCQVADGAAVLGNTAYDAARVECAGPPVDIVLSAPVDWQFDPEVLQHGVDLSLLVQEVALTVTAADATAIRVAGTEVQSGARSAPFALTLGASSLAIDVEVESMSRSFDFIIDRGAPSVEQLAYAKASNPGAGDSFGECIDVSGELMVIGAPGEDGSSTSINGPNNDNAENAGAAFAFRRTGSSWEQIAYLKASNAGEGDRFGISVAVDGNVVVVGAPHEDGPTNNLADSGAAYVFILDPATGLWRQDAILRPADPSANRRFGVSVAISGDVIAVATASEIGVEGVVYVFRLQGVTWLQEDRIIGSESTGADAFGFDVSLAGDLLGVAAPGFNGSKAYVYRHSGGDWIEETILRGDSSDDMFGRNIAISEDRAAVGAMWDPSDGRGVNPAPGSGTSTMSGAVYVFVRQEGTWMKEVFIKSSNSDAEDWFGFDVAMHGDVLVASAFQEDGGEPGVDVDEADNTASASGAVYVFHRGSSGWTQVHYVKASNPDAGDAFSIVALSADQLVIGAYGEDSDASGVGGSQGNGTGTSGSGAAYVIR